MYNNLPKFYWINLDRAGKRREIMKSMFLENPTFREERIKGIDGTYKHALTEMIFNEGYSDKLIKKRVQACAASHLKAIKTFLEDKTNCDDHAFICEDDLSFESLKYWKKDWDEYYAKIPSDFTTVKMCNISLPEKLKDSLKLFKSEIDCIILNNKMLNGTCIYLIKRDFANILMNQWINKDNKFDFTNCWKPAEVLLYYDKTYYFPLFVYQETIDSFIRSNKSSFKKFNEARDLHLKYMKNQS